MAVPMLAVKFREGLQMTVHIWPTSAAMSEPKQVSPIENSQRSCVGSFDLSSKRQLSSRKVDNRSWLTHISDHSGYPKSVDCVRGQLNLADRTSEGRNLLKISGHRWPSPRRSRRHR
jgi:hypothetical protein